MSWYVYIARANTSRYYTGITNNPAERLKKHNSGRGSKFAIEQGPLEMVYISPPLPNKSLARTREIQVKGWDRNKKEKLITGEWK